MTETIRRILGEHAQMGAALAATPDDGDLFEAGMSSHASVQVMLALEDAFDVEFPDELLRRSTFESVDAIATTLRTLGAA